MLPVEEVGATAMSTSRHLTKRGAGVAVVGPIVHILGSERDFRQIRETGSSLRHLLDQ
jgi:hypothetical protein